MTVHTETHFPNAQRYCVVNFGSLVCTLGELKGNFKAIIHS